jgi:hypothetical protein
MASNWRVSVVRSLVGNEAALPIDMGMKVWPDAPMIEGHGPDVSTTLDKAKNRRFGLLAARPALGLARIGQISFVGFHGHASAAQRPYRAVRGNGVPDTMPDKPSGLQSAANGPLKLAGRKAFFAGAKDMNCLQPKPQRKVAILENGAHFYRKRLPASVALAKASTI